MQNAAPDDDQVRSAAQRFLVVSFGDSPGDDAS